VEKEAGMIVALLITGVGSILVTWLLPMALNSERPYGAIGDVVAGTLPALVWAYVSYDILAPWIGLTGVLRLGLSAADAIGLAAVMLWVVRRIKG
jgi:hypothetical protein